MREAIGGSFLLYLVIIFLGIYIGILMFSLSYIKAFKIKNQIISIIEKNEGYTAEAQNQIRAYFIENRMHLGVTVTEGYCNTRNIASTNIIVGVDQSFCLYEHRNVRENTIYYTVRTFIHMDVPILGDAINAMRFGISGETIVIYEGNKLR